METLEEMETFGEVEIFGGNGDICGNGDIWGMEAWGNVELLLFMDRLWLIG